MFNCGGAHSPGTPRQLPDQSLIPAPITAAATSVTVLLFFPRRYTAKPGYGVRNVARNVLRNSAMESEDRCPWLNKCGKRVDTTRGGGFANSEVWCLEHTGSSV
jgi:hypothetical protein